MGVSKLAVACVIVVLISLSGRAQAGILYAIRNGHNHFGPSLVEINTDILHALTYTVIGPIGVDSRFGGLAYDGNSDTLYGVGGRGNESLFSIDRTTGAATTIGFYNVPDMFGLAFDTQNNVLYGSRGGQQDGYLYTLNTSSGAATVVNAEQANDIKDLAYDSLNDRLVGMRAGKIFEIDRASGIPTLLLNGEFVRSGGFAYDSDRNLFWDVDSDGILYSYDPTAGFARTVRLDGFAANYGLAYVPTVPEPSLSLVLAALGTIALARRRRDLYQGQ